MENTLKNFEDKMGKSCKALEEDYATIRAGRANPNILNKLMVDYYGVPTPIQSVANISVPEARIIMIAPWEKSLIKAIEKAINTSDIGINPNNDGKVIRLVFPELTEERRKEIVKDIAKMGEDTKIAVRSIRREAMEKLKAMKKKGEITEDDLKHGEKKIQDKTDSHIKNIDKLTEKKQKQIMEI